jgi:hypothetical protein
MAGRGKDPVEFGDGVLTGRGTLQKFYEQSELKAYLEAQLQAEAIPAGIGTFYLFKDEARQQQFLANRFRRREVLPRRRIAELRLEETRQALEPFMEVVAQLGRIPDPLEFPGAATLIERFNSLKRAYAALLRITGPEAWERVFPNIPHFKDESEAPPVTEEDRAKLRQLVREEEGLVPEEKWMDDDECCRLIELTFQFRSWAKASLEAEKEVLQEIKGN